MTLSAAQIDTRTRELMKATTEAQLANMAKSLFLSSMSHEVKECFS